ncbi:hypothetical protein Salat_1239500 [Sesamum alatum]|uniref:Uncharacterized protein n=1 Tax=Sesamum alatum TaxID=300844 RepID=A0AAE1YGF0_9LAMI|nr:hypothetical protein Salat_1239500 [Sesamum alatum]
MVTKRSSTATNVTRALSPCRRLSIRRSSVASPMEQCLSMRWRMAPWIREKDEKWWMAEQFPELGRSIGGILGSALGYTLCDAIVEQIERPCVIEPLRRRDGEDGVWEKANIEPR